MACGHFILVLKVPRNLRFVIKCSCLMHGSLGLYRMFSLGSFHHPFMRQMLFCWLTFEQIHISYFNNISILSQLTINLYFHSGFSELNGLFCCINNVIAPRNKSKLNLAVVVTIEDMMQVLLL